MPNKKFKTATYVVVILFLLVAGFFYINGSDEGVKKAASIYFMMGLVALLAYDVALRIKLIK